MTLLPASGAIAQEQCDQDYIAHVSQPAKPNKALGVINARKAFERAPEGAPVVVIGDSLAERWKSEALGQALDRPVAWLGVGGDRTQQVLWRLQQMDSAKFKPEDVILLAGTNNLSDRDPACAIGHGLAAIAQEIRESWPEARLWVIETPPRGVNFESSMPDRLEMYRKMESLIDFEVSFVNLDQEMTCGLKAFPDDYFQPLEYGKRRKSPCGNYRDDLLHIAEPGYALLTGKLAEMLK